MKIKFTLIGIIILCLNTQLFANDITPIQQKSDSLVIKKNGAKKEITIYSGRRIKIWQKNNTSPIKGIFKGINQDFLTMSVNKKEISIAIDEIRKLKLTRSTGRKIVSWTLVSIGIIGVGTGIIALVAAAAAESGLGAGLASVAAAVTGGTGVLFLTGGGLLGGRKFELEHMWSIQKPSP